MSGSSVVPGFPNTYRTPCCTRNSYIASAPVISCMACLTLSCRIAEPAVATRMGISCRRLSKPRVERCQLSDDAVKHFELFLLHLYYVCRILVPQLIALFVKLHDFHFRS